MNLSPAWTRTFEDAGIHALHWSEVGAKHAADAVLLSWAVANGYVVFTNDLDFGAILASSSLRAPSVIQIRAQALLPRDAGPTVIRALEVLHDELERGALVIVDPAKTRVRLLPLER